MDETVDEQVKQADLLLSAGVFLIVLHLPPVCLGLSLPGDILHVSHSACKIHSC